MLRNLFERFRPPEPEVRSEAAFRALVATVQADYVAQFRKFIAAERQKSERSGSELTYAVMADAKGLFGGKAVLDFMHVEPRKRPVELQPEPGEPFRPFTVEIGDQVLLVKRFAWEEITIEFSQAGFDPAVLLPWFDRWFDPDDKIRDHTAEVSGLIHKLVRLPGGISVDMGTAPGEAFWRLLDCLREAAVRKMRVA